MYSMLCLNITGVACIFRKFQGLFLIIIKTEKNMLFLFDTPSAKLDKKPSTDYSKHNIQND